jgi:RNA polymerase sigma-70 factor (family 1)
LNPPEHHKDHQRALEDLFSETFRMYEQPLHSLALRLTKSDQAAGDIIQEVFLKLWEHRESMDSIRNMEAWLYRVTENKVIDAMRKAAADKRLREKIWDQLCQIIDETDTPLVTHEYEEIIRKAIEGLPTQRRLIYQLNKEEGLSYQQIADELQISRHTVKNQLFTAMQSVRRFISRGNKR